MELHKFVFADENDDSFIKEIELKHYPSKGDVVVLDSENIFTITSIAHYTERDDESAKTGLLGVRQSRN